LPSLRAGFIALQQRPRWTFLIEWFRPRHRLPAPRANRAKGGKTTGEIAMTDIVSRAETLLSFNPILQRTLTAKRAEMDPVEFAEFVDIISIGLKVDWPPDKLYAMIKTERMATKNNWKLLTKKERKEWSDACREYDALAVLEIREESRS
jgi:hypothetical protein